MLININNEPYPFVKIVVLEILAKAIGMDVP